MRSLKKVILFIVPFFIAAVVVSCKKKKETCCYNILSLRPITLGFVGYDSIDLKNLRIIAYKRDSLGFVNPIDSVFGSDYQFSFHNDTAMAVSDTDGKFTANVNIDYIISLADSSSLHTITKQVNGETKRECIESEHCSPGSLETRIITIKNLHIDGILTEPVSFPPTVFIKK